MGVRRISSEASVVAIRDTSNKWEVTQTASGQIHRAKSFSFVYSKTQLAAFF